MECRSRPKGYLKQITINPTVNSSLATITVVASDSVPTDRGAAVDHGFLEVPVHVTAQTEEGHITGLLTLRLTPATLQLTNVSVNFDIILFQLRSSHGRHCFSDK